MAQSLEIRRQSGGGTSGILAGLRRIWARHGPVERATRLDVETWPDYMLKDIGLPVAEYSERGWGRDRMIDRLR
ncbi:MAG TPA: hypothetical protein VMW18_02870 [Candidatus Binatia bacterium]|nr:hypothetical protein [Candidatus Binatia bacterium]